MKNETKIQFDLLHFIETKKKYSTNWELQKTNNTSIQEILNKTSKKKKEIKVFQISFMSMKINSY